MNLLVALFLSLFVGGYALGFCSLRALRSLSDTYLLVVIPFALAVVVGRLELLRGSLSTEPRDSETRQRSREDCHDVLHVLEVRHVSTLTASPDIRRRTGRPLFRSQTRWPA